MANIDDIEKQIENIKINSDDNKNNVSKNKNILLNGVNLKDHEIKDNVKSVDYNNNNNENDTMNEINKHVKNDEYCNKENSNNNNNNNNNNNLDTQINETLNLNEKFEKKNEENLCSGCKKVLIKKLSCPICLKNKIFSYFCNQECFKGSWKEHQKIHENMNKENNEKEDHLKTIVKKHLSPENFDPTNRKYWVYDDHLKNFVNFKFTGDVRPWPLSKINHVPSHIERPDYAISSIPESELIYKRKSDIYVNNEEEIQRIREACILGRKTLDYAHTLVSPGVTTDEIDRKVHEFIIKNNAYPSTLNYYKFPKSCCTSVNEIVCHGIPDYRPLKSGDIINIDISVFYKGVHSDLNETYFVGDINDVPKEGKELVETCYFSLMEAIKKCKPGMFYKNIGTLIDAYVSKKNFSVVRSYSGHGVGKLFHSNPTVPHFKKNKAVGIMKPGHVFTIEPMINQGHYSDVLWPDQWTSATSDGKLSAQFEHTLLITNNGVEILTKRTQDSPPLGFDTKDELYYN